MTGDKTKVVTQDDPAPAAPLAVDTPAEPKKKKTKTAPQPEATEGGASASRQPFLRPIKRVGHPLFLRELL